MKISNIANNKKRITFFMVTRFLFFDGSKRHFELDSKSYYSELQ
jgi:hypothetical protein